MSDLAKLKAKLEALEGSPASKQLIDTIDYSQSYVKRADGSYVQPGRDDNDYNYDTKNSYGEIVREEPPAPLQPNFNDLLRERDFEGLLTEISKFRERSEKLEARDVLASRLSRYQQEIDDTTGKLHRVLEVCKVRVVPQPSFIAPEPSEENDKIMEHSQWWKREEDDEVEYLHRYKCFKAFEELQAAHFDYSQRESMTTAMTRLSSVLHRLKHDQVEAQGVAALIEQVQEMVDVVLNEGKRCRADEQSVHDLAKAITIDEIKSKQPNPPHSRLSRQGGENFPAVLDIKLRPLPCDEPLQQLQKLQTKHRDVTIFKDLAEAAHVWLQVRDFATTVRQSVHETNATRDKRRRDTEEHYGKVRDEMTSQTLTVSAIREAYGTMGSL